MADPAHTEAGAAPGAAVAAPPQPPAPSAAEVAAPAPAPAAAEAAPAAAAAPAEAKGELTTDKPSLLEEFDAAAKAAEKPPVQAVAAENKPPEKAAEAKPEGDKPAEAKPADAKPAEAAKPAEGEKPAEAAKPADAPKPEPIKFEFELPPVLQANDEKIGTFNALLNEAGLNAELGKDVGQKLLNLHAEGMQAYADHVAKEQHRVFNDTRDGWRKEVMADEQLGGSGYQTSMGAIARVRDLIVPEKDRAQFEQFLRVTGAGDHPAFLRAMHNAARYLDEPQAHEIPNEPRPIPVVQGKGARRSIMYDHPRSRPGGRQ